MKYAVALVIAFLLIALMMTFHYQVLYAAYEQDAAEVPRTAFVEAFLGIAHVINAYWYVFALFIIAACVTCAAAMESHDRN